MSNIFEDAWNAGKEWATDNVVEPVKDAATNFVIDQAIENIKDQYSLSWNAWIFSL